MKNRIFLTADTHFFHTKMVLYCGRPTNFNELIFKGFEEIKETDILIHLGDVCIGNDNEVHNYLDTKLKCKKILVKGNHDGKSNNWYLRHGWDFVCWSFKDYYFGHNILFSHVPMIDNGYDLNIHGHCHNALRRKEYEPLMNDKQILIALENTNYKPVLLDTVIKNYEKTRGKKGN